MNKVGLAASLKLRWLVVPALCLPLSAMTVTFTSVADTSLFEEYSDNNLGSSSLVSGTTRQFSRTRSLFQFDLSTLPAGAVVTDVQVILHVSQAPDPDKGGQPVNSDFNLYRLYVNWGEGTGTGATGTQALAGEATWNDRFYQTVSWSTGGGQIGDDFAVTPSATTAISGTGMYVWGSTTELVDDVMAWQANPAANFGFIMISQAEDSPSSGRRFASSDNSGGLYPAPQLTVTYTIPEPSAALLWVVGLAGMACQRKRRY